MALTGETEGSGGGSVAVQQGAGPGRHPGEELFVTGTGPLRACGLPLSLPCFDSILFRNGHWKRRRRVRILAERKGPQTPLLGRVR